MVRLELLVLPFHSHTCAISIPLWCDWNPHSLKCLKNPAAISIPLWCDWNKPLKRFLLTYRHFNSIIVRLELCRFAPYTLTISISIPLWCDWNKKTPVKSGCKVPISIPLWCDWNQLLIFYNNLYQYFNSIMVRLELHDFTAAAIAAMKFQFHYGAIGTSGKTTLTLLLYYFNSIMVRLEP